VSKRKKAEAEDVEIERSDVVVCLTCKPEKVFEHVKDSAALKAHLADEHGEAGPHPEVLFQEAAPRLEYK